MIGAGRSREGRGSTRLGILERVNLLALQLLQPAFGVGNEVIEAGFDLRVDRKPQQGAQPDDPGAQPAFLALQ